VISGLGCGKACNNAICVGGSCKPTNIACNASFCASSPGSSQPPILNCGNGQLNPGEQCDNGGANTNAQNPNATVCRADCKVSRCGDGIIGVREPAAQNCSVIGRILPRWFAQLIGQQNSCAQEQCDDGDTVNTDECTNTCALPKCGDGIVQTAIAEQCDDGDPINNDECANNCKLPRCGDSIVQFNEGCDDGNTNNTDSCNNNCRKTFSSSSSSRSSSVSSRSSSSAFSALGYCCTNGLCIRGGAGCTQSFTQCLQSCAVVSSSSRSTFSFARSFPSSTSRSSIAQSSSASSVTIVVGGSCTFNECANGGQQFCTAMNLGACVQTAVFPCIQCLPASSRSAVSSSRSSIAPECIEDIQCSTNLCIGGKCLPCIADNQCAMGLCLNGVCAQCMNDMQCAPGQRCIGNSCLNPDAIALLPDFCGNARTDAGEECDDGSNNSNNPNALCRLDCRRGRCGDGILDTPLELCDDGNLLAGDGCTEQCQIERTAPQELPATIIELPFNDLSPVPQAPVIVAPPTPAPPSNTDSGPAALLIMISGAAAGWAYIKRKRRG
jgi:cysteine-rich repeat protein